MYAGTSGDTGGAAICSARGLRGVDVVVVFPRGRITPVQEKQMTTNLDDNIHVFAGEAAPTGRRSQGMSALVT